MEKKVLIFVPGAHHLSLGVEMELQVLDKESLFLTPRAYEIIENVVTDKVKPEFFQSSLEMITGVCKTVQEVAEDFSHTLEVVRASARKLNLALSSTGTHPEADYRDRLVTPSPRYHELMDRNQWIIRRMAVYGMHIHLGMPSGDECIRFHNFFLNFVPHLVVLSASSPFWQRLHTGLSSSRPTMYESMPTSGMPHIVKDWRGFESMYRHMIRTNSIKSISDLWLDLRPSPALGTLEIRVCDEPATLEEVLAIVAFVHAMAHWYHEHQGEWERSHKRHDPWILRENKWRAIRYGLNGELIFSNTRKTVSIKEDMATWMERLVPFVKQLGYEAYFKTLQSILTHGNSSDRQLTTFKRNGNLHDVIIHNVSEFEKGYPLL